MPRPAAPPRLTALIVAVLVLAALVAGCGSSGSSGSGSGTTGAGAGRGANTGAETAPKAPAPRLPLAPEGGGPVGSQVKRCESQAVDAEKLRATGLPCGPARQAMFRWQRAGACALAAGASRGACSVKGGYRCQAVRTGKGVEVSCATPGRAVAFVAAG